MVLGNGDESADCLSEGERCHKGRASSTQALHTRMKARVQKETVSQLNISVEECS